MRCAQRTPSRDDRVRGSERPNGDPPSPTASTRLERPRLGDDLRRDFPRPSPLGCPFIPASFRKSTTHSALFGKFFTMSGNAPPGKPGDYCHRSGAPRRRDPVARGALMRRYKRPALRHADAGQECWILSLTSVSAVRYPSTEATKAPTDRSTERSIEPVRGPQFMTNPCAPTARSRRLEGGVRPVSCGGTAAFFVPDRLSLGESCGPCVVPGGPGRDLSLGGTEPLGSDHSRMNPYVPLVPALCRVGRYPARSTLSGRRRSGLRT